MKLDSLQDSSRVVVSEIRHGGVLPGSRAEMWRDVYLLSGAHVHGPIWGNSLHVEGPNVHVDEAVYVRGPIRVSETESASATGDVDFRSSVTSPDSLVVDAVPFRVRFLSSIYTGALNLNHAIVYGNVYARTATLRNTIVLGGVYCKAGLRLENCAVSTFRARKAEIGPRVRLFFPLAMAQEPIQFSHPVKALPFYDLEGAETSDGRGGVTLDRRDVYVVEHSNSPGDEKAPLHILSMDERVLDTNKLLEQFKKNRRFLECLSLGRHLDPEVRRILEKHTKVSLEDRLMSLLEAEEVPEVHGSSSVEDLFARPAVLSVVRELASEEIARRLSSRATQPK